jgi:hypothetical protein
MVNAAPQPDSDLVPREPETEKGRLTRSQYLTFAQTALNDSELDYLSLYRNSAIAPHSAQALDQSVAALALKSGIPPRQVIQLLAQGVFTQQQTRSLPLEEKQAALPKLLQYAQAIVESAQRQRFVEYANTVTGKSWSYPDLYRDCLSSDLAAIQLDQKVAAAGLRAGESVEAIAALLQHSPYAQFQRDVKGVQPGAIEQYAKGTVAQVQEIQALRPSEQKEQARRPRTQSPQDLEP